MPFLLPHEMVAAICKLSDVPSLLTQEGMDPGTRAHLTDAAVELRVPPESLLGLGLWCDGVPCNYDRTESLEVFTLNFPGFGGATKNLRVPITCINRRWVQKEQTFDDILEIVTWSLKACALGRMPAARPGNQPWRRREDRHRQKCSGDDLPLLAVLAEVRGDWKMYKETFRLPAHNENSGICFLCTCTPQDIRPYMHE